MTLLHTIANGEMFRRRCDCVYKAMSGAKIRRRGWRQTILIAQCARHAERRDRGCSAMAPNTIVTHYCSLADALEEKFG